MNELFDRILDRYQVITAIVDHATFDMHQNTNGGTWGEFLAELVLAVTQRFPSLFAHWDKSDEEKLGSAYFAAYSSETRISQAVWLYLHKFGPQGTASMKTGLCFPQWPVCVSSRLLVDGQDHGALAYRYLTSWLFTEARAYMSSSLLHKICFLHDPCLCARFVAVTPKGVKSVQHAMDLITQWVCMRQALPFPIDIISDLIRSKDYWRQSAMKWTPDHHQPEDPGILALCLLKIMFKCTASRSPQVDRSSNAIGETSGNQRSVTYDYAAFKELISKVIYQGINLDSRVSFCVRLFQGYYFLGSVWGCPE